MKREFTITERTRQQFLAWFAKVDLGKPLAVTVEEERAERTNTANARHRKLVGLAADHSGMSNDEFHRELCCLYFGEKQVPTAWGTYLRRPIRTTTTNEQGERDVLKGPDFHKFAMWAESFIIENCGVWLDMQEAA